MCGALRTVVGSAAKPEDDVRACVDSVEGGSVGVNTGMIVTECAGSSAVACTEQPLSNPTKPIDSTTQTQ